MGHGFAEGFFCKDALSLGCAHPRTRAYGPALGWVGTSGPSRRYVHGEVTANADGGGIGHGWGATGRYLAALV